MKKLSKSEKQRRGTYDPSKERQLYTFSPLTTIPAPTIELTPAELAYFNQCCEAMISSRTLTGAYIPGISRAAKMYGHYLMASEQVAVHGTIQTTQSGYTAKNGYFQVLCDCEKNLASFEKSMGLNIVSQSKLPPPSPVECYTLIDEIDNPEHIAGTPKPPPVNRILELQRIHRLHNQQ